MEFCVQFSDVSFSLVYAASQKGLDSDVVASSYSYNPGFQFHKLRVFILNEMSAILQSSSSIGSLFFVLQGKGRRGTLGMRLYSNESAVNQ